MKQRKKSVIPRLIKECKHIALPIAISSVITLFAVTLGLYAPSALGDLTQKIYDVTVGGQTPDFNAFLRSAAILAAVYVCVAACESLCKVINCNTVSRHFTRNIRVQISDKISRISVGKLDATPNGEIMSRMMNDVSMMSGTVYSLFELFISGIVKLILIVVI